MRSNIIVLAVFVLISSTWAAPLTDRPLARRSLKRRSVQPVLSRSSPEECPLGYARGSMWTEEACSKMPGVIGFKDALGCRKPSSSGTGSGTCFSKNPISRVYRRMVSQGGGIPEVIPKATSPSDVPSTISPPPGPKANPSDPPSPGLPPSQTSEDTASITMSPDTTASPPAIPASTLSEDAPVPTPTDDPKTEVPPSEPLPEGPNPQPGPDPVPSLPIPGIPAGGPTQTTEDVSKPQDPSPVAETSASPSTPSAIVNAPPAAENVPPPVSPIEAPFAAPKPKASPTSAATEAIEGSSSVPSASSSDPSASPTADTPISHGTEAAWGGTLNTVNEVNSPKAGARKKVNQKPMKLKTVLDTLFFDLVYGRFLF